MKKLLSIVLSLCILTTTLLLPLPVSAETTENTSGTVESTNNVNTVIQQEIIGSSTIPVSVRDYVGLSDGTLYYIMNKSSGRFLALAGTGDADYQDIVTIQKTTSTQAQWTLNIEESKKSTLASVLSSIGKTMGCDATNNILLSPSSETGNYEFAVFRSTNDAYQGLYCIRYGPYFVSEDANHDVRLTTTATAASFWSFMKVAKGSASMISFNYNYSDGSGAYNSSTNSTNFLNAFNGMGYTTSSVINTSVDTAFTKLQTSDIFLYSGHGNNSLLAFCNDKDTVYAWILGRLSQVNYNSQPNIKTIEDNLSDNDLCNARCVFYLGCNTGLSDGNVNLVDSTFDKGVHFVFGVCDETYCEVDKWLPHFFASLLLGKSVGVAIDEADDAVEGLWYDIGDGTKIDSYFNRYYVGDTSQYLYIQ